MRIKLHGAKPISLLLSVVVGLAIWMIPSPEGMDPKAWALFAIFFATIFGIIAKALPMGAMAILAMAVTTATQTLPIKDMLSGFASPVIWLIVVAFFIAKSFVKTGLGMRIAYYFVGLLGKRTLGLSYGLGITDLLLSPAIPSTTARAGGLIYPILKSLALTFDSSPEKGTERRIGSFLVLTAYQINIITSAMFLTSMAANPLMVEFAQDFGIEISWGFWALAACVPGLLSLIIIPYLIYRVYPPEIKETPRAAEIAHEKLAEMGKISTAEWVTLGVFALLLVLWIFGGLLGAIDSTTTAFIGLGILLITGVLTWEDIKEEKGAWDTLIWFATLMTMASFLNKLGFIPWFSGLIQQNVTGLDWHIAFPLLVGIYFYSHYLFASNTAHVTSMFAAFLGVGISVGVPPMLMALSLAFSSSLFASITHYGAGPAPILFGSGYVSLRKWWEIGALVSVVNILIWIGLGGLWWKIIGVW